MSYYIRVLGTDLTEVPVQLLKERASPALIEQDELADSWHRLVLRHSAGPEIAVIVKNQIVEGELGQASTPLFYFPSTVRASRWPSRSSRC